MAKSITEFNRVLKPGGLLSYCEPSNTITRKVLTSILMSPLSSLTQFSKAKRSMVQEEWETLNWWLKIEKDVPEMLEQNGFTISCTRREALKTYLVSSKDVENS